MTKLKISLVTIAIACSAYVVFEALKTPGIGAGIDVRYVGEKDGCTQNNPILVTITNRMPIQIDRYAIDISAKNEGHSNIVRSYKYWSDKIIPAFSSDEHCWEIPDQNGHFGEAATAFLAGKNSFLSAGEKALAKKWAEENPSLLWSGRFEQVDWN